MGDESHSLACQEGNQLMYVTLLLAILGSLNGNQVVIAQSSSCFSVIPLVDFVMTRLLLSRTLGVKTYGGAFGLNTPKPMQLASNNRRILAMAREFPSHTLGQGGCVDRDGPRYTGRLEDLQMSEEYTREFARAVVGCMMAGFRNRR